MTFVLDELQKDFLDEIQFLLDQTEESYLKLEDKTNRSEELQKIFRMAHSMKGAGAAVGFTDLSSFAHHVEDCLSILRAYPEFVTADIISLLLRCSDALKERVKQLKTGDDSNWNILSLQNEVDLAVAMLKGEKHTVHAEPAVKEVVTIANTAEEIKPVIRASSSSSTSDKQSTGIKIDSDRVENVLNLVGELVVIKSQLMNQTNTYATDIRLNDLVSLMDKTIRELQDKTLSMRMTPLKPMFLKAQRIVRDLSVKLAKPVELMMFGEETEIDRTMVDLLNDPLMHIVRNSLDHGIEKPENRKLSNKSDKGKISIRAQQIGGRVLVKIEDDGGGISRDRVLKKATENGLVPKSVDPKSLSDKQVFNFIFMPGFSTAEKVTDVSGRGVGMDVVKTNIEKLKGTIDIDSEEKKGTTITISIPLTTSITDGMIIRVSNQLYILPMDNIVELVNMDSYETVEIQSGSEVVNHRGKILPLVNLNEILQEQGFEHSPELNAENKKDKSMFIIADSGLQKVALRMNEVLGQTQVVLKSLAENFQNVRGVAGAAILGDVKVALVLDAVGLQEYMLEKSREKKEHGEHFDNEVAA